MGGQHVSARGRKRRERTEREGSRNQVERSFSSWSYLSSGIGGKEIHVNERKWWTQSCRTVRKRPDGEELRNSSQWSFTARPVPDTLSQCLSRIISLTPDRSPVAAVNASGPRWLPCHSTLWPGLSSFMKHLVSPALFLVCLFVSLHLTLSSPLCPSLPVWHLLGRFTL